MRAWRRIKAIQDKYKSIRCAIRAKQDDKEVMAIYSARAQPVVAASRCSCNAGVDRVEYALRYSIEMRQPPVVDCGLSSRDPLTSFPY